MDTNSKTNTTTDFDSNPPIEVQKYDDATRLFCGAYEQIFTLAYSALRSMLDERANLLVVGAGTGMELCEFGKRSPQWLLTGVDPSAGMLSIAKRKITESGLTDNVRLIEGYTHDLPETESYDAATCILVMHFLPDDGSKLNLLKSISQRLKKGAPLVLVDGFGDTGSKEFKRILQAWSAYPVMMGVDAGIVQSAFEEVILKLIQFVPETRILSLLDEAGFECPAKFFTSFLYGGWLATKR